MGFFVEFMTKGGPFMYAIVMLAFLHMAAVIVQCILAKKVDATPLLWAGVGAIMLTGMLGSVSGLIQAFKAVGAASAEQKQALLASGISISMYTTEFALMIAVLGLGGCGLAATLVRTFRK